MASMEGQKKENQPKGMVVQLSQDRGLRGSRIITRKKKKKTKSCSRGAREELGVSYRAYKNCS